MGKIVICEKSTSNFLYLHFQVYFVQLHEKYILYLFKSTFFCVFYYSILELYITQVQWITSKQFT